MDIELREMGQRIRAARRSRKMTIEQLSELVGIANESLGHIECGSRKTSLQTLLKIADILQVSLDYLTGRSPSQLETVLQQGIEGVSLTADQAEMLPEMIKSLLPYIKETK